MADKITQLVNKAGDNLYPLSGGTLSDSITTDMIKDGAVTSDKIDWTTLNYTNTEQVVGTWINGKPLYRRVIEKNLLADTETWLTDTQGNGITPIFCYGYIYNDTKSIIMPIGQFANNDSSYTSRLFCDQYAFKVQVGVGISRTTYPKVRAFLYYTKTTD